MVLEQKDIGSIGPDKSLVEEFMPRGRDGHDAANLAEQR